MKLEDVVSPQSAEATASILAEIGDALGTATPEQAAHLRVAQGAIAELSARFAEIGGCDQECSSLLEQARCALRAARWLS